jgi:hypothetical protein
MTISDQHHDPAGQPVGDALVQPGQTRTETAESQERPVTYYLMPGPDRTWLDARDRYDELTQRDLMARSLATLKARGEYDPAKHGSDDRAPLTLREHLEVLANGEVVARVYRHPCQVHQALEAGATWQQIADATGTDEAKLRAEYRKFAEGQHQLWAEDSLTGIRLGLDDAQYAEAIARAGKEAISPAHSGTRTVTVPRDDLRLAMSALRDLAAHGAEPLGDFAGRLAKVAGTEPEAGQ